MIKSKEMVAADTGVDAESDGEPRSTHAPPECEFQNDPFAETSSSPTQSPEEGDITDCDLPAAAQRWRAICREAGSVPARDRKPEPKPLVKSMLIAAFFHAALLAVGILSWKRPTPPSWHFEKGDGMAPGDASAISGSDTGSEQRPDLPGWPTQSAASEPLLNSQPLVPPEEVDAFAAASMAFENPSVPRDEAGPAPILIGIGSTSARFEAPAHWKQQSAIRPVAASTRESATTRPAPHHADGAIAGSNTPQTRTDSTAGSAGSRGKPHVRTHPGPAGAAGRGGSPGGLDGRGVPIPDYPVESQRRGEQAVVQLEVEVLSDGSVGRVKAIDDAGFPRLAAAATTAVRRARFTPATDDGKPVSEWITIPFRFVLR